MVVSLGTVCRVTKSRYGPTPRANHSLTGSAYSEGIINAQKAKCCVGFLRASPVHSFMGGTLENWKSRVVLGFLRGENQETYIVPCRLFSSSYLPPNSSSRHGLYSSTNTEWWMDPGVRVRVCVCRREAGSQAPLQGPQWRRVRCKG